MADIHNRMPAIIAPEHYGTWLDPDMTDVEVLLTMLGPYPERLMDAYPVSRKVNSPSHDGPDLIVPEAS
jgi:putative SOS response-associated peptidase YedK